MKRHTGATPDLKAHVRWADANILHASGHNLSKHDRWQVYVVFNPVVNRPADVPNARPDDVFVDVAFHSIESWRAR